MTIKYNMTCDKCGFKSESVIDFANKTFSRVATDGSDVTEYFHLCKGCQDEINRLIRNSLPKIDIVTVDKTQYQGVDPYEDDEWLGAIIGITEHKGVIVTLVGQA